MVDGSGLQRMQNGSLVNAHCMRASGVRSLWDAMWGISDMLSATCTCMYMYMYIYIPVLVWIVLVRVYCKPMGE